MSDESTQTNVSALEEDEEVDDLPRARQHPLPWILFGFAAILLALVGGLLAKRLGAETRRANEAIEKSAGFKAQLEQANKQQSEVDAKIAAAEAKAKAAEEATAAAAAKLKQVEAERDKLQKELEAAKKAEVASAKEPAPAKGKAAAKTKAKKKKRRR